MKTEKTSILIPLLSIIMLCIANKAVASSHIPTFQANEHALPDSVKVIMKKYTWHPGCPIELNQLRAISMSYWGFDNKAHIGTMIVNKTLAAEVIHIFKKLYQNKFPIYRMQPLYYYQGNDEQSLAANNTASFNCRTITGKKHIYSHHAYGRAIDINPLQNPYVKGAVVLPPVGKRYIERNPKTKGIIIENDIVYNLFKRKGWQWGGEWFSLKDYQHFEKVEQPTF